jgi:VCBS repeat-containing protein
MTRFSGSRRRLLLIATLVALLASVPLAALVLASGSAPVPADLSPITAEDTLVHITLSATDTEGDPITFALGGTPQVHGTLGAIGTPDCPGGVPQTCTAVIDYTPTANYNGSDIFTYTANDGFTTSSEATVSITITAVNDPPTAAAKTPSGAEDTVLPITLSATDVDGDGLTFAIGATSPSHGGLGTISNLSCDSLTPSTCTASVSYTPNANYHGSDSVTYTANDGTVTSAAATVSITITAVNDAPVCPTASKTGLEDSVLSGTLVCTDVDGDSLTYTQGAVSPANGNLTLNTNGTWSYTPDANYNGSDSFTYRANDGTVNSTNRTVTLTVTAVNDPPTFTKGANQVVNEDSGAKTVTAWATNRSSGPADESGQTLAFSISGDTNASLFSVAPAVASNGTLTFTPGANRNGLATVTVRLTDNGGTTNGGVNFSQQTFTITVNPINDPPNAANDVGLYVNQNAGPTPLGVLANDSDLPDSGETLTIVAHSAAGHGTVAITGGGTGLTYTPAATYVGGDAFTYTISDGSLTDTATVLLNVVKSGTVTRLAGPDRYATSAAVSRAYYPAGTGVAFIATGLGFADALAGAPLAGKQGGPILLVRGTSIPASVVAELTRLKPGRIVILGGTGVVSAAVATQLGSYTAGP